jgi:hypothetical protein
VRSTNFAPTLAADQAAANTRAGFGVIDDDAGADKIG